MVGRDVKAVSRWWAVCKFWEIGGALSPFQDAASSSSSSLKREYIQQLISHGGELARLAQQTP